MIYSCNKIILMSHFPVTSCVDGNTTQAVDLEPEEVGHDIN